MNEKGPLHSMWRTLRRFVGMLLLLVICSCGGGDGAAVPDGDWELVRLEYDGGVYAEPLFLRSEDGLLGGNGACNSFGQEADGSIVQTTAGCDGELERIDEVLIDAIQGRRRIVDGRLTLQARGVWAEYRSLDRVEATEFFAILVSDRPDTDPSDLLFEPEGGPPMGWDRLIEIETDVEGVEFHVGHRGETKVCLNVGVTEPRVTGSFGCEDMRRVRNRAFTMAGGYPVEVVRVALIPDQLLLERNVAQLESLGAVYENLFVPAGEASVSLMLSDESGHEYLVEIPELNPFQG